MAILVGCEESQVVTKAFRDKGYFAYSCDLQPTRGNPAWHIQGDIKEVIRRQNQWDLIILHPPCDYLALTGNRWYGVGKPKHHLRVQALAWTLRLWQIAKEHSTRVALENPRSAVFQYIYNVQYIQPWMFGHGEVKATGIALHGLPPLIPTNVVDGREERIHRMYPTKTRKRDRSETYPGIAHAMASQWGKLITSYTVINEDTANG